MTQPPQDPQGSPPGYPPQYPPGYAPPPPYPPPYGAYAPVAPTNTMAILALIFGIIIAPLGIVFGVIARNQIKQTGEQGEGMATAGLVIGIVLTSLIALMIVLYIIAFAVLFSAWPNMN